MSTTLEVTTFSAVPITAPILRTIPVTPSASYAIRLTNTGEHSFLVQLSSASLITDWFVLQIGTFDVAELFVQQSLDVRFCQPIPVIPGAPPTVLKLNLELTPVAGSGAQPQPTGPQIFYDGSGKIDFIEYDDGSVKEFSYTGDKLVRIDWIRENGTTRKDFVYAGDQLQEIIEYEL